MNIIDLLPKPNTIKHILIYTNLENYDPRCKIVFEQSASYYIKTNNDKKSIDNINLKSFTKYKMGI